MKRLQETERTLYFVAVPLIVAVTLSLTWLTPLPARARVWISIAALAGAAYAGFGYWIRTRTHWDGLRYTTPLFIVGLITFGLSAVSDQVPAGFILYFPAVVMASIRSGRNIGVGTAVLATVGYFLTANTGDQTWLERLYGVIFVGANLLAVAALSGAIVDQERGMRRRAQNRRVHEQSALLRLADALSVKAHGIGEILGEAVSAAATALTGTAAVIVMRETGSGRLKVLKGWGALEAHTGRYLPAEAASLPAAAVNLGMPATAADLAQAQPKARWKPETGPALRAGLAVPMTREGRARGALALYAAAPRFFSEDETHLLSLIGSQALIAIERLQAEEAVRVSERQYRLLFENNPHPMWVYAVDTLRLLEVNRAACEHYGYAREEFLALTIKDIRPLEDLPALERALRQARPALNRSGEWRHRKKDGTIIDVEITSHSIDFGGRKARLVLANDITVRKRAERAEREQRDLAEALRDTAEALSSTLNFDELLDRILANVGLVVPHDSANIMLVADGLAQVVRRRGEIAQSLEGAVLEMRLPVETTQTLARMAETRRTLVILDTQVDPRWRDLEESQWVRSYAGAPIRVKGKIIGFLNLNSAQRGFFTAADAEHLLAFADQAGVAIENAQLFNDLQRFSAELALAYDATLEGWSRFLDLRDRETEGHTQRVTDMTMRLAQSLGLDLEPLTHIRRGALLHDIGKMGIPDRILLKPGPLTDEEWQVMRLHPVYAYNMLSPIEFLHPALDIPYSHHEKWDGTGYPQGLEGEQIPLAARLFAVVDVWDALRSDRPYRRRWPESKIVAHLRSLAGVHFDPAVVEAFLRLMAAAKVDSAAGLSENT